MTENVLLNGNFDLWQRGADFLNPPHFTTTVDRFVFGQSSGAAQFRITRSSDVPNFQSQYSLDISTVGAYVPGVSDESHIRYGLEGREATLKVAGKIVTFSFWVKSNLVGVFSIALVHPSSDRSVEKTITADYSIFQAGVWEKKVVTVDLSLVDGGWSYANATYGLKIRFSFYAGNSFRLAPGTWCLGNYVASTNCMNLASAVGNYLRISQLKLEVGAEATPFRPVDITTELRRCQRYCFITGSDACQDSVGVTGFAGAAGETAYTTITFPVSMAKQPVVTVVGAFATANVAGDPAWVASPASATMRITAAGPGRMAARSASSVVIFDAEF